MKRTVTLRGGRLDGETIETDQGDGWCLMFPYYDNLQVMPPDEPIRLRADGTLPVPTSFYVTYRIQGDVAEFIADSKPQKSETSA